MEQDLLRIRTAAHADRMTMSLCGELDLSSAPRLIERLAGALEDGPAHLDVDLSRLDYTDSVGLSVFVTAHFQCFDAGIELQYLNPNQFVRELLAVTGLDQVFSIARTDALVEA
ncbi:MAG TPA: STAS domain-containing protein [Acidimicrobiales bacterium]|jgi:anti-anti-sigma factor|nr:STAS domain-containing protein [Acidimicrobiales bacterium]